MTIASGKTAAVIPLRGRKVQHYNPEKGLRKIAAAKAGEERARRARDAEGMFREIVKKLKAQAAYIVWRDAAMAAVVKLRGGKGGKDSGHHSGKKGALSPVRVHLPDADPGEKTAHRWRRDLCSKVDKVTVVDEAKFALAADDAKNRALRACERQSKGTERGTAGTGEFERYTPPQYIEAARKVLGEIDLDPATSPMAQKTVRAKQFFTEDTNGLDREWHGRVWLNPPYHRDLAPAFISKLVAEIEAGHVTAAVMLTNNSTDTDWFDTALRACASVCFTHGRIAFTTPPIGTEVDPTQGQAFFYYGDDPTRFEDVFCVIGSCVRPSRQYVEVE
jgi:phage N-6-adenine-methyltransferase